MSDYLSVTNGELKEMLSAVGASSLDDLFVDIAEHLRIKELNIPSGKSQQEVLELFEKLGEKNKVYKTIMRGAGAYHHFIPPAVTSLAGRSEFLTAYTPYQAELSQGILQAIFEYQTMICALTGMEVSNASVYNGSSAAAEACLMCLERNKNTIIVSDNINPRTLEVMETYLAPKGATLKVLKSKEGRADTEALLSALSEGGVAACYIEQPNYFGLIEDLDEIGKILNSQNTKFIAGVNPIAMGILKPPGECGADIVVGEGQPLGIPLSFGGPYLGFMACSQKETRRLPGRIVGETVDKDGNRAYVLTLQAREQHIRRDKAASNICSNQAHCALTAAIYMSAMGKKGLEEVASLCLSLAHYASREWEKAGAMLKFQGEFFHEFVTVTKGKAYEICKVLDQNGILAGLPLNNDEILWCITEMVKKDDIDRVSQLIKGVLK